MVAIRPMAQCGEFCDEIISARQLPISQPSDPALQDSPGQVKKQIPAFLPAFGTGGPIRKANNNATKRK